MSTAPFPAAHNIIYENHKNDWQITVLLHCRCGGHCFVHSTSIPWFESQLQTIIYTVFAYISSFNTQKYVWVNVNIKRVYFGVVEANKQDNNMTIVWYAEDHISRMRRRYFFRQIKRSIRNKISAEPKNELKELFFPFLPISLYIIGPDFW